MRCGRGGVLALARVFRVGRVRRDFEGMGALLAGAGFAGTLVAGLLAAPSVMPDREAEIV